MISVSRMKVVNLFAFIVGIAIFGMVAAWHSSLSKPMQLDSKSPSLLFARAGNRKFRPANKNVVNPETTQLANMARIRERNSKRFAGVGSAVSNSSRLHSSPRPLVSSAVESQTRIEFDKCMNDPEIQEMLNNPDTLKHLSILLEDDKPTVRVSFQI